MNNIILLALVIGLSPEASAAPTVVSWNGHRLTEVQTLKALSKEVQAALHVGQPGIEGIADTGRRFNKTDVVDPRRPMRRFIVAGIESGTSLVAFEQGGRGYNISIVEFTEVEGKISSKHWTIFKKPKDLKDVVKLIDGVKPE